MAHEPHQIEDLIDHLLSGIEDSTSSVQSRVPLLRDLAAAISVQKWVQDHNEDPAVRDRSPRRSRERDEEE